MSPLTDTSTSRGPVVCEWEAGQQWEGLRGVGAWEFNIALLSPVCLHRSKEVGEVWHFSPVCASLEGPQQQEHY